VVLSVIAHAACLQPMRASRRSVIGGLVGSALVPLPARAANEPLSSGPFTSFAFNGMDASSAPPGSMPYDEFVKAVEAKKVEGVVFQPPSGNEAYAIIEGKTIRMGAGWPVEESRGPSSTLYAVQMLEEAGVPYAWNFNLKAKASYKTRMAADMEARSAK